MLRLIIPKESSLLINQIWQPLPGTRQSEIYPYLRKPDLLSSNSCLIRTPEQIILIDAGALAAQTADLGRIIKECHQELSRPVIIYLNHCRTVWNDLSFYSTGYTTVDGTGSEEKSAAPHQSRARWAVDVTDGSCSNGSGTAVVQADHFHGWRR